MDYGNYTAETATPNDDTVKLTIKGKDKRNLQLEVPKDAGISEETIRQMVEGVVIAQYPGSSRHVEAAIPDSTLSRVDSETYNINSPTLNNDFNYLNRRMERLLEELKQEAAKPGTHAAGLDEIVEDERKRESQKDGERQREAKERESANKAEEARLNSENPFRKHPNDELPKYKPKDSKNGDRYPIDYGSFKVEAKTPSGKTVTLSLKTKDRHNLELNVPKESGISDETMRQVIEGVVVTDYYGTASRTVSASIPDATLSVVEPGKYNIESPTLDRAHYNIDGRMQETLAEFKKEAEHPGSHAAELAGMIEDERKREGKAELRRRSEDKERETFKSREEARFKSANPFAKSHASKVSLQDQGTEASCDTPKPTASRC